MASAGSVDAAPTEPRWRAHARDLAPAAAGLTVAGATYVCGRVELSYETTQWPLVGLTLLGAVWLLVCAGRRPDPLVTVSAASLVALGGWTLASPLWGGLPDAAWSGFDSAVLAAAALVAGTLVGPRRSGLVALGVLVGIAAQAVEILVRVGLSGPGTSWFYGRMMDGPAGYHNAQGSVCAVALPLAVLQLESSVRKLRATGAVAGVLLVATLLLTQSRGALVAAGIAVAVQTAVRRNRHAALGVATLVAAGAALAVQLRSVDAALTTGTTAEQLSSMRHYVFASAACAAVLAAVALLEIPPVRHARYATAAAAVALAAAAATAVVVWHAPFAARAGTLAAQLRSSDPPSTAPGATRFTSITPNGRFRAWRVAAGAVRDEPFAGLGAGQFTRRWTKERLTQLYILQPHSLELELASETGIVGLTLFAAFAGVLLAAIVRAGRRATAAAAAAAFGALMLQASVDWTWSFAGLVAPVLLLVGAAAGAERRPRPYPRAVVVLAACAVVALGAAFAAPYAAQVALKSARAVVASDPASAARQARLAHRLDPWAAGTVELEGRLAQGRGDFALAAARYARASSLSRHAWLDEFLAARMLARLGDTAGRDAACGRALAANPLEPLVRRAPCTAIAARVAAGG